MSSRKGIHSLENDVLSSIFEQAVCQCRSLGGPLLRESPLNLSQTCHSWREFLLNNGRFWTNIDIRTDKNYDATRLIVSVWLERSRDAVINVRFGPFRGKYEDMENETIKAEFHDLIRTVMQHQRRLASLSFDEWIPNLEDLSPPIKVDDVGKLTVLELSFQHSYPFASDLETDSLRDGNGSPLFFLSHPPSSMSQPIAASLQRLVMTEIQDEAAQQAGLIVLLQHCPKLRALHITTQMPPDLNTAPRNLLHTKDSKFVCLNSLDIIDVTIIQYNHFLRFIRAPNLRCLRVEAMLRSTSNSVVKDILRLIGNSNTSATLRDAHLCFEHIDEEDQLRLLRKMPEITTLETNFIQLKRVYNELSLECNSGQLCPKLEKLDITAQPEDLTVMQQVLFSRFTRIENFQAWVLIGNPRDIKNPRYKFPPPLAKYQTKGRLNGKRIPDHIGLCYPIIEWGWCGTGRMVQTQTIIRFNRRGY